MLKAIFGCLLCVVLPTAECFAVKGGPVYPAGRNIVGTYAGVLEGAFDPTNPRSSNTLGIFSLGVPQTGLANGSLALFTGERTFVGSIQGIGDPNRGTIRAALQGIPVVTGGGVTIFTLNFHADGLLNAQVKPGRNASAGVAATRLVGSAVITTTNRNVTPVEKDTTTFAVDGFKQSSQASSVTVAASPAPG